MATITDHAKDRMAQRSISKSDIEWVMGHGDQYNTEKKGVIRAVSLEKKIAVIFNRETRAVITVISEMDEETHQGWLAARDQRIAKQKDQKKWEKTIKEWRKCFKNTTLVPEKELDSDSEQVAPSSEQLEEPVKENWDDS